MKFNRSAGILLHPTSLPGKYGIGDLGDDAFKFIDLLENSGQMLWQVFPLGPTGYGDSPYQCFSAFAGNPLLISPDKLLEEGLLSEEDVKDIPEHNFHKIDYGQVIWYKTGLLQKAYSNFKAQGNSVEVQCADFCAANSYWLDDYALFMAVKEHHGGIVWTDWDKDIALRKQGAVERWEEKLRDTVDYQKFLQFIFHSQWNAVRNYAHKKNIQIIGDLPIFIAYDSADLWANKKLFTVDEKGKLELVAGVPPDYFSKTGQLWGNPLYKWKEMEKDDYSWWQARFRKLFDMVDIVRIDHFRGFDAYWEIPGNAKTAIDGRWVKGPGEKLFTVIKEKLGNPAIIAEDLGVITESVVELRDKFEFPGIKIMQFAFGNTGDKKFLPHNYPNNCVVHTGSHDNDTTRGFFDKEKEAGSDIFIHVCEYLGSDGNKLTEDLIKAAFASVADTCVIPMQDILNLGSEARMNFPGKPAGNWTWRFTWNQIPGNLPEHLDSLALLFERKGRKKTEYEIIEVEEE